MHLWSFSCYIRKSLFNVEAERLLLPYRSLCLSLFRQVRDENARSVAVIDPQNRIGETSSNPGKCCCVHFLANKYTASPPSYGLNSCLDFALYFFGVSCDLLSYILERDIIVSVPKRQAYGHGTLKERFSNDHQS